MCQIQGNVDEIHWRKTPLELSDIGWISRYDGEEKKSGQMFWPRDPD